MSAESAFQNAAAIVEGMLNNRLFNHKKADNMHPGHTHIGADHSQFTNASVSWEIDLPKASPLIYPADGEKKREVLRLVLKDAHNAYIPSSVADHALTVLSELPALKPYVQFADGEQEKHAMQEAMREFIDAGAEIPKTLLNWQGFLPRKPGLHAAIDDYALNIRKESGQNFGSKEKNGIVMGMYGASADRSQDIGALLRSNITERLPAIKELLTQRIAKYKGFQPGSSEYANLAAQVQNFSIEVGVNDMGSSQQGGVFSVAAITIHIRSKEQMAHDQTQQGGTPAAALTAEQQKKLDETNPLFTLPPEQLGKALGRSFLYAGGEKAMEIAPYVFGRKDVLNAVGKGLAKLKIAKPDLAEKIDAFLASDEFKNPWRNRDEQKTKPRRLTDDKHPGAVIIEFDLPATKPIEVVNAIAALRDPKCGTPDAPATAAEPKFAKVDSVDIVGVSAPGLTPSEAALMPTAEALVAGIMSLKDVTSPDAVQAKIAQMNALIDNGITFAASQPAAPVGNSLSSEARIALKAKHPGVHIDSLSVIASDKPAAPHPTVLAPKLACCKGAQTTVAQPNG